MNKLEQVNSQVLAKTREDRRFQHCFNLQDSKEPLGYDSGLAMKPHPAHEPEQIEYEEHVAIGI